MKKEKLIDRRVVGLRVIAGGRSFPQCSLVYEATYLFKEDGVLKTRVVIERGRSVHGTCGVNFLNTKKPTKKQIEMLRRKERSDLYDNIHAAAVLMRGLETACLQLDEIHGMKTGHPE